MSNLTWYSLRKDVDASKAQATKYNASEYPGAGKLGTVSLASTKQFYSQFYESILYTGPKLLTSTFHTMIFTLSGTLQMCDLECASRIRQWLNEYLEPELLPATESRKPLNFRELCFRWLTLPCKRTATYYEFRYVVHELFRKRLDKYTRSYCAYTKLTAAVAMDSLQMFSSEQHYMDVVTAIGSPVGDPMVMTHARELLNDIAAGVRLDLLTCGDKDAAAWRELVMPIPPRRRAELGALHGCSIPSVNS